MNAISYYELSSKTMDPCTMAKPLYEQARKSWLCTGCAFPKPGTTGIDVTIQEAKPDDTPLNGISGCGLGIARKDFLFSFGEEIVHKHLHLGRVFGSNGRLLDNWVTFIGRHKIIVRGSNNAGSRCCSGCGRIVYFATGPFYLCPKPVSGVEIFDSGNGGLVVTAELAKRIKINAWRKLICTELPVLDIPKDGFNELRN